MLDKITLSRRQARAMAACVAVAILFGPAPEVRGQDAPQDYPQWRGHNRDGAASAFAKPESWPEHLRLRWRVDVGEGYATPIVVGNTVYAFTRRAGKEGMTALDAETGKTVWRTDYPVSYEAYEERLTTATVPRRHRSSTTGSSTRLGSAGPFRPSMRSAAHSSGRNLHHRYNRSSAPALHRLRIATSSLFKLMAIAR